MPRKTRIQLADRKREAAEREERERALRALWWELHRRPRAQAELPGQLREGSRAA
jgi:hypothetical protein